MLSPRARSREHAHLPARAAVRSPEAGGREREGTGGRKTACTPWRTHVVNVDAPPIPMQRDIDAFILRVDRLSKSFPTFLKEEVWILDPPPGRGVIKWEAWGYLEKFAGEITTKRRWSILKARQLGFSWLLAAYAVWVTGFQRGARVLMTSQGQKEATELLEKAGFVYDHLDPMIKPRVTARNTEELAFGYNLSGTEALPSTDKSGSSYTASVVIADEHAKHPYAELNFAAIEPTINAGGQFISVSSAFGSGNLFHQTYQQAKDGLNGFEPRFFGCFLRPGRDEGWYEETKRVYASNPKLGLQLFHQEYPRTDDEAFEMTQGVPYFERESIDRMKAQVREPLRVERDDLGYLKVWQDPLPGEAYVVGTDVSYGLETPDAGVSQIIKWRTGELVASLWGHYPPDVLVSKTLQICQRYGRFFWGLETNGVGEFALRQAQLLGATQHAQFYHRDWEKARKEHKVPQKAGWYTDENSRPVMLGEFAQALRSGACVLYDQETVGECNSFIVLKNKPQAAEGCHDDRVMALAIAWQMRQCPMVANMAPAGNLNGRPPTGRSFVSRR